MDRNVLAVGITLIIVQAVTEHWSDVTTLLSTTPSSKTSSQLSEWSRQTVGLAIVEVILVLTLSVIADSGWEAVSWTVLAGATAAYLMRNTTLVTNALNAIEGK